MSNSELQIIRNDELYAYEEIKIKNSKRKVYFLKFTIFILVILTLFGGIFFIRDRFENIKSTEENLNLQKQKLSNERLSMEKTLKEESDKLLKLQLEYENKNKELTQTLDSIKVKEETLNSEIAKIEELKDMLIKQLSDVYSLNMSKQYGTDSESNDSLNGGIAKEDNFIPSMQSGVIGTANSENTQSKINRVLSIANADWLVKFDSLGEFNY